VSDIYRTKNGKLTILNTRMNEKKIQQLFHKPQVFYKSHEPSLGRCTDVSSFCHFILKWMAISYWLLTPTGSWIWFPSTK